MSILDTLGRWSHALELCHQLLWSWFVERSSSIPAIEIAPQHGCQALGYCRCPTTQITESTRIGPNPCAFATQAVLCRLHPLLQRHEALPLNTFNLLNEMLPPVDSSVNWPLYSYLQYLMKFATIGSMPAGSDLSIPYMTSRGLLPIHFFMALPTTVANDWLATLSYPELTRRVTKHFPLRQGNAFMNCAGAFAKLSHWLLQGNFSDYWDDRNSRLSFGLPACHSTPMAKPPPLTSFTNWHNDHNEGWLHWSISTPAFRTNDELSEHLSHYQAHPGASWYSVQVLRNQCSACGHRRLCTRYIAI